MTHGTPDPLKPGHIPGQNPDTLQRLPGHTRFYRQSYRSAIWLPALKLEVRNDERENRQARNE